MAEQTVPVTKEEQTPTASGTTRDESRYLIPPVDIYETEDGLVVLADLPGVNKEDVSINLENGILSIEGCPSHTLSGNPLYEEFTLLKFFRQFEISDRVDSDKIEAELKNGVLRLHLPKAAQAKPRKIEVKA